jgi:hypothetical protein
MILYLIVLAVAVFLLSLNVVENLDVPNVASSGDVSSGSSELYGWGYKPIKKNKKCSKCKNIYIETDICVSCHKDCRYADITKNVNIDKYVLKSSIPPCPNMSEYAKKSQIPAWPFNKNEWIRKSEIPPCPRLPDMTKYVLKSALPGCKPYKCPRCPTCPTIKPWRPKTYETGFIPKDVPLASTLSIERGVDTIPKGFADFTQTNY